MLASIGVGSIADLLAPLPGQIRVQGDLDIPPPLDEPALVRRLRSLAERNVDLESHVSFLGAGIYDHFCPAVVSALIGRSEFSTAYTPYQPELSQGMLQATYEYQSLVCALTGMDIANASMYDAATALAEAALMACEATGRRQVVVSRLVHPHYREVLATYMGASGYELVEAPAVGGRTDEAWLREKLGSETACVLIQHPNFLGALENVENLVAVAHRAGALSVISVDPISLGLLKPPAEYDADVVIGEGQSLGNPMAFGGPLLGFFACKKRFARQFPGRIVGATKDIEGRRAYTMTLRTREQDIRREKATSNICTNEALLALSATIYLCELGKTGLRQVADLCLQKAHYAFEQLQLRAGVLPVNAGVPFFKEFAVRLPVAVDMVGGESLRRRTEAAVVVHHPQPGVEFKPLRPPRPDAFATRLPNAVELINARLLKRKIVGGLPLGRYYSGLQDAMLVCVTETKTKEDIDLFVSAIGDIVEGRDD